MSHSPNPHIFDLRKQRPAFKPPPPPKTPRNSIDQPKKQLSTVPEDPWEATDESVKSLLEGLSADETAIASLFYEINKTATKRQIETENKIREIKEKIKNKNISIKQAIDNMDAKNRNSWIGLINEEKPNKLKQFLNRFRWKSAAKRARINNRLKF